jgi:hypothetical protein
MLFSFHLETFVIAFMEMGHLPHYQFHPQGI